MSNSKKEVIILSYCRDVAPSVVVPVQYTVVLLVVFSVAMDPRDIRNGITIANRTSDGQYYNNQDIVMTLNPDVWLASF